MLVLDYEKAAAIVGLSTDQRLAWAKLGRHIFRGRRRGMWKAALNENEVARATDRGGPTFGPRVKKARTAGQRRKSPMKPRIRKYPNV